MAERFLGDVVGIIGAVLALVVPIFVAMDPVGTPILAGPATLATLLI